MSWIGRKKLAFIPISRTNAHPPDQPMPPNWPDAIMQRVFFDPDADNCNRDRCLRAYIQSASSGRADLDGVVLPMVTLDETDVPVDALESQFGAQLRGEGFDAAALVMLGLPPTGTAQRGGFWARFDMSETLGVWAMEFMHVLTGFADLYPFGGNMGGFDEMACSCGTHPSAYTKRAIGWLDDSAIAIFSPPSVTRDLHAIGLTQPPPLGRATAIQIGVDVPYLMVEARINNDQFESPTSFTESGIPSQGVIVYQIQTTDPLGETQNQTAPVLLLTTTALGVGQSFTAANGATVTVQQAIAGGFTVSVEMPGTVVPDVYEMSETEARHLLQARGLVPKFSGTGTWVSSQEPAAGTFVAPGTIVSMALRALREP
jgi:hypothetical protein